MSVNGVGTSGAVSLGGVKLDELDVQTAIQLVLSEKSQLFNQRLETMVKDMQGTNKKISEMTQLSAKLTEVKNGMKADSKNDTTVNDGGAGNVGDRWGIKDQLTELGVMDAAQNKKMWAGTITMGEIDTAITKLKQMTDSLSADANLQQIALNRLIGLKDNTDNMLASLVKKFGDTMAQIISKVG